MGKYLGPGLLGLGVTAMIAGFMSGMAGNVSAFATVWTYDVYKPLINKNASDHHYLNMGRPCSLVGVLISIGTAYFSSSSPTSSTFFQALGLFFLIPLFRRGDSRHDVEEMHAHRHFWGFLVGILSAIGMYAFVHTFPDGHRPVPQVALAETPW